MESKLALEFQTNNPEFAVLFDQLLSAEKQRYNYPSPGQRIETYDFYPEDPAELTYEHLGRGHFTEAVQVLDQIFGPCHLSREACYLQAGFYPGRGPDIQAMRLDLLRLQKLLHPKS